jgi:hypothetical protein
LVFTFQAFRVSPVFAGDAVEAGVSSLHLDDGKPWFLFRKTSQKTQEGTSYHVVFSDPFGKALSTENFSLSPRGDLKSYDWKQSQTGEEVILQLRGSTLTFSSPARLGEKERKKEFQLSEKERANLVVPALITDFMQAHWQELETQGTIEMTLAAPDRMDTFGLKVTRDLAADSEQSSWEVSPRSFFVRLVASPVHMIFGKTGKVLKIVGLEPPVYWVSSDGKKGKKKVDLDFQIQR